MKKNVQRALSCAFVLLLMLSVSAASVAQEMRLGNLIYVPAMSAPGASGTISLSVQGISLAEDSDEPQVTPLAGAQFCVYVYSSTGELTPWANPLYPSEPMRVRSGEEETLFSLPQGMEFYLKQESAPQGYLFDPDELIPVTGDSIVVKNAMPGQIAVSVMDRLGAPLPGVELTVTSPDGSTSVAVTDENGVAAAACTSSGLYTVSESTLPEGVFAVLSSRVTDAQGDKALNWDWPQADASYGASVEVEAQLGARAHVTFEHPATGTVRLCALHAVLGDDGETKTEPLSGVRFEIAGSTPSIAVSDEDGQAQLSLLEGTYEFRLSYDGALDAVLPADSGLVIVEQAKETTVELTATQSTGRIAVQAQAARSLDGGSVTLVSAQDGSKFGPYPFDADGLSVSEPLSAGVYYIEAIETPDEMELGPVELNGVYSSEVQDLDIEVTPGALVQLGAQMFTWESQTYDLLSLSLDDKGQQAYAALKDELELTVLDLTGAIVGEVEAQDGRVRVNLLSGEYVLRMEDDAARALGINAVSRPFELPSEEDAIVFAGNSTRLHIYSVDENGMAVSGAQYSVRDAQGDVVVVDAGAEGEAVTPPLVPGEIVIESLTSPKDHDSAQPVSVWADAGEVADVQVAHPIYGESRFTASVCSLDAQGAQVFSALSDTLIRIYRVEDGGRMADTGIELEPNASGRANVRLPEGEYAAQLDALEAPAGLQLPQAVRFEVYNTQSVEVELTCMDALGGVRAQLYGGELTDAQMAQVVFELVGADGDALALVPVDGGFYAGDLAEGVYVLRQTQMPQGYTLCAEREVEIHGGEVSVVDVPLEEYALVTISKTGLTFNDQLQTFVVPLTGEYGVFVMEEGELRPYPNEEEQATVWANVTPEQIALGMQGSVRLPASIEGTAYFLRELDQAKGFARDSVDHEITVFAGETAQIDCTVSSDRGFFSVDLIDAYGAHVAGGAFELADDSGETVLSFEMGETAYQNQMALPVGAYTIRQTHAAQGYTLADMPERELIVEPYLTQGGTVTRAVMACVRIPQSEELALLSELYAAREQGLTMITVDAGELAVGEALNAAQLTLGLSADGGERVDAIGVVIPSATDAAAGRYMARVEYCLTAGGWQPSDARMTTVLDAPTVVNLSDVQDDVCAVRITYLNADTGLERVDGGFAPGSVTLSVRVGAQAQTAVTAYAQFGGAFAYQTGLGGESNSLERSQRIELGFVAEGDGAFDTLLAGRDGRVSGTAFVDEDADGLLDPQETRRYAGLNVSLVDGSGNVIETQQTDEEGHYEFTGISSGTYSVHFDADGAVIFSQGEGYTEHLVSSVRDTRYGDSDPFVIDGDHTDRIVHVGCVDAAQITGQVNEIDVTGEVNGFGGMNVELRTANTDEPVVVMTADMGEFTFTGLMPGSYEVILTIPDGYLCAQADESTVVRAFELDQGDAAAFGEVALQRAGAVSGRVRIDDNGDGAIDEGASGLAGVGVALLRVQDGHAEEIARTLSAADGSYRFENLYDGEYSVLFELSGEWAFTRSSEDSLVESAMSQTGSTPVFELGIGQTRANVSAGVTLPAQLTVSVFQDNQRDGQYGGRESMLAGVGITLVRLQDGVPAEEMTAVTDVDGNVVFARVSPGEYMLRYQMPGTWRASVQVEQGEYPTSFVPQSMSSTGESGVFSLAVGQTGVHLYIGAAATGTISGKVYYDDDANASMGEGEAPVQGVVIELIDSQQMTVASTVSAADGSYSFDGIAPGRYRVQFTSSEDIVYSASERSMSRGGVQASDGPSASTRTIVVYADGSTTTADAGIVRLSTISGVIWVDRNADCEINEDEAGLSGVEVQLMNGAGRSVLESAVTDASGVYAFERVQPGNYMLRVDAPEGYVFSGALTSGSLPMDEARDARGYSVPFTILGGAQVQNASYGLFKYGSISGRVWEDVGYDGLMDGEEVGLREASLTLLNAQGESVATVQTGRSGEYSFKNLTPGEYSLSVTLPLGYVYTAEGGDSRALRTDEAQVTVQAGLLEMGEAIEGLNIGALRPAQLSGVIWLDTDDDGRRQTADSGVQGARVRLDMLTGADAGRSFETVADETGTYRFDAVMPGQVRLTVEVDDGYAFSKQVSGTRRVSIVPQTDALTAESEVLDVASGAQITTLDVGVVGVGTISGVIWEDSAYDGVRDADEPGVSGTKITLIDAATGERICEVTSAEDGSFSIGFVRLGSYNVEFALPEGMIFTRDGNGSVANIDASQAQAQVSFTQMGESLLGVNIGAIWPASIEGRLIIDENEDGTPAETEAGLEGAVVTAMQGGIAVATTRTDANGNYALNTLRPGEYRVRITLPQNALFALGTAPSVADTDVQEAETLPLTLSVGEKQTLAPVATVIAARISGRAWNDADADGEMDASERALTGVIAELLSLDAGKETVLARQEVNENGYYAFAPLRSGTYAVRFTLPGGMLFADRRDVVGGSSVTVVPGSVGSTDAITLSMGEEIANLNVGAILYGSIGDTVWLDVNGNGLQDYKEPLVPGVRLLLMRVLDDGTLEEESAVLSDEYGYYRFSALRPGRYVVQIGDESTLTQHIGAPLGEIDSDLDPQTGMTDVIVVRSGETLRNIDVGLLER